MIWDLQDGPAQQNELTAQVGAEFGASWMASRERACDQNEARGRVVDEDDARTRLLTGERQEAAICNTSRTLAML